MKSKLPLIYSCSGASSAAQMANHIAVKLDRLKVAEMSCIAGVGGDVEPLVRTAKSGRPIIAMDGCPLHCAAKILRRHGLRASKHYDLSKWNIRKRKHQDFDPEEAAGVLQRILQDPCLPAAGQVPPAATPAPNHHPAVDPPLSTSGTDNAIVECSSPPCYSAEFNRPPS